MLWGQGSLLPVNAAMKRARGFTLLELLVVIGLIALIMSFSVSSYSKAQLKSRDLARKNDLKQMQKALELYKNDLDPQTYPVSEYSLVTGEYIKEVPVDPRERGYDGSWVDYDYTQISASTYTLTACLEDRNDDEGGADCAAGSRGKLYTLTEP